MARLLCSTIEFESQVRHTWALHSEPSECRMWGSAGQAVAFKSGRRAHAPSTCPCRRQPKVIRAAAPATDPEGGSPGVTEVAVIYGLLCLRCSKTSFLLRCFGPFGPEDFLLALSKTSRFTWVWGRGGGRSGKNDMLKVFSHSWAKFVVTMAQHRANI